MKQATSGERDAITQAGNEYADKATVATEAIRSRSAIWPIPLPP
jgi:hypothetical protein